MTGFKVVDVDNDGCLICEDENGEKYNCGETLDEFGVQNLYPDELDVIVEASKRVIEAN